MTAELGYNLYHKIARESGELMITVWIDGKVFKIDKIHEWETARVKASQKKLNKKTGKHIQVTNADELAEAKAAMSDEEMMTAFRHELAFSNFFTNIIVRLSGKKRKFSVTEIDVDFCDSKCLSQMYDDMMLSNTSENRYCCLRANPDHYLLRGTAKNTQEVLEVTGGLPVVSLFDIHYGDFAGLQSPKDEDYPLQAAGVSYLKNGLAIGAVRHQMKDTESGCHIKLTVEFPLLMPNRNIKIHQYHLACEFYNWFSEFEKRTKEHKI